MIPVGSTTKPCDLYTSTQAKRDEVSKTSDSREMSGQQIASFCNFPLSLCCSVHAVVGWRVFGLGRSIRIAGDSEREGRRVRRAREGIGWADDGALPRCDRSQWTMRGRAGSPCVNLCADPHMFALADMSTRRFLYTFAGFPGPSMWIHFDAVLTAPFTPK